MLVENSSMAVRSDPTRRGCPTALINSLEKSTSPASEMISTFLSISLEFLCQLLPVIF